MPPDAAVVSEDSQVGWGYGSGDSGSGSTGLSGGLIVSGGSLVPCRSGQNSLIHFTQETKYSVMTSPGTTFSVTCTPTATDTATASPNYYYGSAGASVGYVAAATPIVIDIYGGIGPSSTKHFMIGQSVFAFLNTGGFSSDSYRWTVSGGKPFDNYAAFNDHATYC